jgi:hypothetical protein
VQATTGAADGQRQGQERLGLTACVRPAASNGQTGRWSGFRGRALRRGAGRRRGWLVGEVGGDRRPGEGLRERVVVQADVLAVERDPAHRADAHGPRAGLELDVRRLDPLVPADADVVVAGDALAQRAGVDADLVGREAEALAATSSTLAPEKGEDRARVGDLDAEDDLARARADRDAVGLRARFEVVAAAKHRAARVG